MLDENLEVIPLKSWLKTSIFFFVAGGSGALFKGFGVIINFGVLLLHLTELKSLDCILLGHVTISINILIDCAAPNLKNEKCSLYRTQRGVSLRSSGSMKKLQKLSGREAEGRMRSVSGSGELTQLWINPTRWIHRQRHATVAQNCEINLHLISFHRRLFKAFPSSPLSWGCGGGRWFLAALCQRNEGL